ncbi:MAG: ribokinase [Clostridia bacterium]|nr:ribokinase [Clostridia bacterium]
MNVLVFGSMNIDRTYTVGHFVRAGETLTADRMELFCGGKGFNQAIALSRAGVRTQMAGAVGTDGDFLLEPLKKEGVDLKHVKRTDGVSGHAVIQVNAEGNNCIIILAGANGTITHDDADRALASCGAGDWLVLQNEISSLDYIICTAKAKGMTVVLNPSPFNETLDTCDFRCIDYLLVNEIEAAAIAKCPEGASFDEIRKAVRARYPQMNVLMTLGHRGSVFEDKDGNRAECGVYRVNAVDTTAAGDCFTGFFLAELIAGKPASAALKTAAIASGISVSRKGASPSIPTRAEVDAVDRAQVPDHFER